MNGLTKRLPAICFGLLAVFMMVMALRSRSDTTVALVASSLLMFATCWASAIHLLGARAALHFVLIAGSLGWFAEQMGATHGWFFGDYDYTDVLGWRLGEVPMVIPLMWFSLTYTGYVLANLIVERTAVDDASGWADMLLLSFLAAMIVTAFDLGADPYFVFTLKAWIMAKTDGGWFGETIQGFVGWMLVSFVILMLFRLSLRRWPLQRKLAFSRRDAFVPLGLYAGFMVFQMLVSQPLELRVIAFFAMGIPLLSAVAGWRHWRALAANTQPPVESGSTPVVAGASA